MQYEIIDHVVNELSTSIGGAKISKIHQPAESLIIIKFWDGRSNRRLLLCADSKNYRIHLTEEEYLNPSTPPRFCQLLRARLTKVSSIEMLNEDRIVQINGSGDKGLCQLIVELTGKTSNMILTAADGKIIDCLKRVTTGDNNRGCQPGTDYVLPLQSKSEPVSRLKQAVCEEGQTWNQHVENLYKSGAANDSNHDLKRQLKQTVARQIKKLNKRFDSIDAELKKQQNPQQNKQFGELILANLYQIERGVKAAQIENYYLDPPEIVTIPLDPLISTQKNAEKYFQRYKKLKKGSSHSQRRREETEVELQWLEQLEYQLEDSVKKYEVEEIASELREAGLLKEDNRLHRRRTQQESQPFEVSSPSGFKIIWGRNNRQNDLLSNRMLKSGDLWFHAHQSPGTHVILKAEGGNKVFTDEDRYYAAAIAAGYSRRKNDSKVEVMQAEASAVKKPKNSRTGLVTVQKYTTLLVRPQRIES